MWQNSRPFNRNNSQFWRPASDDYCFYHDWQDSNSSEKVWGMESAHKFPVLLNIVNDLSNIQSFSSVQDQSFFASSLHNFLVNFIHFIDDEDIPPLNKPGDLKIECNGTKTVSSSPAVEPLSLTPTRLKSISTMRDTLGQLEADFTQFQITSSGDLQNMKVKLVQQDNLLKLQKTINWHSFKRSFLTHQIPWGHTISAIDPYQETTGGKRISSKETP